MSAEIRSLGRHALIYSAGNMLAKLTSLLMLPIYTRYLTTSDYGVLELLSMTIDLIGILAGMALSSSVYRFYTDYKSVGEEKEVVSTAAIGMTGLAVVTAAIGILAAPTLSHYILREHGDATYFRLFFLIYVTQTAELVPFLMCRALHRSRLVVTINLFRLVALLSLNILFVVYLRAGVAGILFSQLIVSAVVATGMMIFLFRNMGTKFSWPKFREMAHYGYPVAFASIGNFFLVFSDRYFLNHFVGMGAVGVYAIAYRFAFILSAFVFNPFQQIWGPQRFAIAKLPNARDIYRRVFLYVNIPLGLGALAIALFARDLLKVMATHGFVDAYRVVPLILVAQILHHWTAFNNLGLFLTKTTKKFAWGSAVAVPAVLLFNITLIPWLGLWGAALATIGAYVVRFVVIHKLSQHSYHIDYDWPRITRLYLIIGTTYGVRAMQRNLEILSSVLIGGTLLLVAVYAVWAFVLHDDERRGLIDILHRRWPVSWRRATQPTEEPAIEVLKVPVES